MEMMQYTVSYKMPGWWFWRRLRGVVGDDVLYAASGHTAPMRVFTLADKRRVELPCTMMIRYDARRHRAIEDDIRRRAGQ